MRRGTRTRAMAAACSSDAGIGRTRCTRSHMGRAGPAPRQDLVIEYSVATADAGLCPDAAQTPRGRGPYRLRPGFLTEHVGPALRGRRYAKVIADFRDRPRERAARKLFAHSEAEKPRRDWAGRRHRRAGLRPTVGQARGGRPGHPKWGKPCAQASSYRRGRWRSSSTSTIVAGERAPHQPPWPGGVGKTQEDGNERLVYRFKSQRFRCPKFGNGGEPHSLSAHRKPIYTSSTKLAWQVAGPFSHNHPAKHEVFPHETRRSEFDGTTAGPGGRGFCYRVR